ncbi:hypothetical protein C4K22_4173 [Pseudomonas chlororaphis subsp. aurantiaca]|nr:hypothetical protein C4K22_4173 [Pseudomonas chlororaphis subsp. aurantiaca]AZD93682.1 hypothetical protein C4K13_4273 [Pseudomonas chlororaphis subsp. aureofaciens]AZD43247.1 hypothetical protein C4K21_4181 [Pseudomonas chlororaphis subsp. aurantiaca]AZD49490.1 hypothetical protein C4K20_4083 [Pseudomonas chlororaphis subsp. aurantiaca]AZD80612.1 hypothetical protein C4K15_4053 [Pseudomonas chlororaphis subsp. aurantiaca]
MGKVEEITFWGEFKKAARESWKMYWKPLTWTLEKIRIYIKKRKKNQ